MKGWPVDMARNLPNRTARYIGQTMSQPKERTSLSMAWKFCLVNYYVVPQVYLNFLGTDFFHHPVATSKDLSFIVGENAGISNHPSHV